MADTITKYVSAKGDYQKLKEILDAYKKSKL